MAFKPICPYCGIVFDIPPKRSKKCPSCGNVFYVRNSQNLLPQKLLRYADAIAIDAYEDSKPYLESLKFDIKKYYKIEKIIEKKQGKKPRPVNVIWELLKEAAKQNPIIYYNMAIFLGKIDRDPNPALEKFAMSKLLEFKRDGIDKVEISSAGNGCSSCNRQKRFYSIDDALKKMPIPNKNCKDFRFSDNYPFCRCDYLPVIE